MPHRRRGHRTLRTGTPKARECPAGRDLAPTPTSSPEHDAELTSHRCVRVWIPNVHESGKGLRQTDRRLDGWEKSASYEDDLRRQATIFNDNGTSPCLHYDALVLEKSSTAFFFSQKASVSPLFCSPSHRTG